MEGVARIAALAADALWRRKQADFFVVADGGSIEACGGGELTDFHFSLSAPRRAVKPEGAARLRWPEKRQQAAALQSARVGTRPLQNLRRWRLT